MLELFKRIKSRREELGMSQDELAKKIGYRSRSSVNKIEKGENDIPQSKIVAFAAALNTTPEYLMGWDSEESFSAEEFELINGYRKLSDSSKQIITAMIRQLNFERDSKNLSESENYLATIDKV